jgi:hypothetical protein
MNATNQQTELKPYVKQWDSNYSTYFWDIFLDEMHPQNKVEKMRGYSKKQGENERNDKFDLLCIKVKMFVNQGYLKRIKYIQIYKRAGLIIDRQNDPCILTLYPENFEFADVMSNEFKRCAAYIADLYKINSGALNVKLKSFQKSEISRDIQADPNAVNILTMDQLVNHCARLKSSGYPDGVINHFYKTILDKKPYLK